MGLHVCLWLQEVHYFVKDVLEAVCSSSASGCPSEAGFPWLLWLLRKSQVVADGTVTTGTETLGTGDNSDCWSCLQDDQELVFAQLAKRAVQVFGKDPDFVVIPHATPEEQALLRALETLTFHCRGCIRVLPFEGPDPVCSWSYVYTYLLPAFRTAVLVEEPQWAITPLHGPLKGRRPLFSGVVRVFTAARCSGRMFLFALRDDFHEVWGVPGGAVARGRNGDRCFMDTAKREWNEEVPCISWETANESTTSLLFPVSKLNSPKWVSSDNFCEPDLSRDGVSNTVWAFVAASSAFFLESEWFCLGRQLLDITPPEGKEVVYMCDAQETLARIHTHGAHLMEHVVGTWLELDHATGEMWAPLQGVRARADLALLFHARPPEVWNFLNSLPDLDVGDPLPPYEHRVALSTVGVRSKLAVYRNLYPRLGRKLATELLYEALTKQDTGPYDVELVQYCVERGADVKITHGGRSLLYWALVHEVTPGPVIQRAASVLLRAGLPFGSHESSAAESQLQREEDQDRLEGWRQLVDGAKRRHRSGDEVVEIDASRRRRRTTII
eukprot:TRINITY_DN48797_c0_g1_i1.p1 TRINITY_DN48797_c0_g1~~TRINITY_DN48797_c0_g1_i1.p1  ORF type:complete len:555 (+),score=69.73 TRINITY_DN48797_c0_g1_i1:36-1700(+)